MRIFSSFVLGAVVATDCDIGDFCVTSCNDANNNNATAMTISVDQDYMEQHHNDLTGTFTCDGSDCTKTIQGAALTLNMTDSNYIFLEHEMITADQAVANSDFYFAGRTTTFKCKYPRAVSVDGSFTVSDPTDPDPYVGDGTFNYDIQSEVSGGRTRLTITQEHGIPSLVANVENCNVTFANVPGAIVHPVRNLASWGDTEVCKDNRFGTAVNHANGGATIDWRTFQFNEPNGGSSSQQQDVICAINVSDTLTVSTPPDCSCTTSEQACNQPGVTFRHDGPIDLEGEHRTIATGISIPIEYELRLEMNIARIHSTDYRTLIQFQVDGSADTDCGGKVPQIHFASAEGDVEGTPHWDRMNRLRFVLSTCYNNSHLADRNGFIYRDLLASDVIDQWVQVKTGHRYETPNGRLVWYLQVGPDDAPFTEVAITQYRELAFTNVNMNVGWFDADSYIRNIAITDTAAANANT